MARQARYTWRTATRGPEYPRVVDLISADFLENGNQPRCAKIGIRGPLLPQRLHVALPKFREWRLTLKSGVNIYREIRQGDFSPLAPPDITRFEYLHEPGLHHTHARLDLLLCWLLKGLGKPVTADQFAEAVGP